VTDLGLQTIQLLKQKTDNIPSMKSIIRKRLLERTFQTEEKWAIQNEKDLGRDLTDHHELYAYYHDVRWKCGPPTWGWLISMWELQQWLQRTLKKNVGESHSQKRNFFTIRMVIGERDTIVDLPKIHHTMSLLSLAQNSDLKLLPIMTVDKKHSLLCDHGKDLEELLEMLFSTHGDGLS
jgi:hypothetical protein